MELMGFLERDHVTRSYRPSLKVLELGFTALNSLELVQIAQPQLKSLSNAIGATTNMAVRDGSDMIYIARNLTQQIMKVNLYLGSHLPVYCTSMGKALLIDLSRQELADLLGEGPYRKMGPNTITNLDDLMVELDKIRQQGYAINNEELAYGLRSVGAPVFNYEGKVIAAINVSVAGSIFSREELEERLVPKVMETANQISASLGAPASTRKKNGQAVSV